MTALILWLTFDEAARSFLRSTNITTAPPMNATVSRKNLLRPNGSMTVISPMTNLR